MSSVRTVTVVPAGLDPFARRRTVTNPLTGQTVTDVPLTGPVSVTVPLGPPGEQGPAGTNGAASPAEQDPALLYRALMSGHEE